MNSKRKFEEFDPNESDSNDENFEPVPDSSPRRTRRKNRKGQNNRHARSKRPRGGYHGSDIEDEESLDSDSEDFIEDNESSESEDNTPLNKAGRRTRKAAAAEHNWIESSDNSDEGLAAEEEESGAGLEDDSDDQSDRSKTPTNAPRSYIVRLKVSPGKLARQLATSARDTRARSEEPKDDTNQRPGSSHTVISTTIDVTEMGRPTRSARGMKGMKVPNYNDTIPDSDPVVVDDETEIPPNSHPIMEDINANVNPSDDRDNAKPEEAAPKADDDDEEDDDDIPVKRRLRGRRAAAIADEEDDDIDMDTKRSTETASRSRRLTRRAKKKADAGSDFEPNDDESGGDNSDSDEKEKSHDEDGDEETESPMPRRRGRPPGKTKPPQTSDGSGEEDLDQDELAEELHELTKGNRSSRRRRRQRSPSIIYDEPSKRRRAAAKPAGSYFMAPLNTVAMEEDEADDPAPAPARRRGGRTGAGATWERPLNTTYGPFGGATAGGALLSGPWGTGATGGVDSDSSDDEMGQRSNDAGNVGVASGSAGGLLGGAGGGDLAGAAPNVGKLKNHKALADADPLGVDLSVDFSKVGGLEGHIDKLKEMVQLPLLYPELFQRFHVTPPRGVLFHGPPGTGKTLLARALSNSVTSGGKKISFYMRKGADALSKWVGEAEKQLRLLFEEARRTQPSIIFFDEIDGLAPVRSSKQEQIHASIVSTLLALMDGMDGRGQVIVIGATNRPDNIDPALRRPGRFDREFYFPLPDLAARRSILDIHTKDWGLADSFKDKLAESTKGYGGADLRALCTEAALNSIQRAYPQIYASKEKLIVDADKINVHATDFMISIKDMIPSSERSASSVATPLPVSIAPLLQDQLCTIKSALDACLPRKKKTTALEEAMYEQHDDADHGFGRENLHQEFERSRVFRPRLLIHGEFGMGQTYLAQALLHYLEGVHVQTFDFASLLADGRSMEQVIVSQFTEIRRHKPSVIFIPNVEVWFASIENTLAYLTFRTMLKTIPASDPVLLLATADCNRKDLPPALIKDLFSFTQKNIVGIARPSNAKRRTFFESVTSLVLKEPTEFPNPENRRKRVLETLPVAPPPPPREPSKDEIKALLKRDRQLLNQLKVLLQPIMDQINRRYRKFRQPVIPFSQLHHLYNQLDPELVSADIDEIPPEQKRFKIVKDKYGVDVLHDNETNKIYYNLETTTIEERLSNGFYARPGDFLFDIRTLAKDSRNIGDKERTLKANELVSNVEVDVATIESTSQVDWESLYQRQLARAREAEERLRKKKALQEAAVAIKPAATVNEDSDVAGPVTLGEQIPGIRTTARFQLIDPPEACDSTKTAVFTSAQEDTPMGGMEESNISVGNVLINTPSTSVPPSTAMKSLPLSQKASTASPPTRDGAMASSLPNGDEATKVAPVPHGASGIRVDELPDTQPMSDAFDGSPSVLGNQSALSMNRLTAGSPTHTSRDIGSDPGADASANTSSVGNSTVLSQSAVRPSQAQVDRLLAQITERTSGCTIEQLEQIGRELMDEIWRTRGEWNRIKVLEDLTSVFNDVIGDIEDTQGQLISSQ
ncbi:putative AAA domain-containing protein C31G5.19 [Ceratocystis fimbriata CBS 114723]|uniref:Putative AAA domain-containing protein C31G5.19 n=1 Tax=Ceratocystis fimbriata CBS 114723 TaxID=1035309 RepID=A0A2C5WUC6_9PEZI|nr:putative AAA domain-containing protein C31G5.19 [Ceratocystis fimbriata CBS 114723]